MATTTTDLAAGRLVLTFDHRLELLKPYFLFWDVAPLNKPYGRQFQLWGLPVGGRQAGISSGEVPLRRLKVDLNNHLAMQ